MEVMSYQTQSEAQRPQALYNQRKDLAPIMDHNSRRLTSHLNGIRKGLTSAGLSQFSKQSEHTQGWT